MYSRIKFLFFSLVVLGLTGGTALATTIDLTTGGSGSATAAIGGMFRAEWLPQAPAGSGVYDSFVRMQGGGSEDTVQGFNTSLGTPLDDLGGVFTHAVDLALVPIVTIVGTDYREFVVDINESGNQDKPLLSLNQVQIFLGPDTATNFTLDPAGTGVWPVIHFPGASGTPSYTEVFRMNDASGDIVIELNYALQSGSGQGDARLLVPNSAFGGVTTGNLIFYSQFGKPPGTQPQNDGYEEWALRTTDGNGGEQELPEPATLLLTGAGLVALAVGFRRKFH